MFFATSNDLWYLIRAISKIINNNSITDSNKIILIKREIRWFLKRYKPWKEKK